MNRRKRLSASNATGFVLLVIGAVVAVNLIGTRLFGRLDLTENHVYTLSHASKEIVAPVPDYLTVKAYISKDLPPELANTSRYVRDLLDDYQTYSKGKLRFEAFDPASRQEDRGRGRRLQGAEAADPGDALAEVRGRHLLARPLLPVPGEGRRHPGDRPGRGARVRDLVDHQADDAEEAQGRLHHRPRRAGPDPGVHLPQARRRPGVRLDHRQPVDDGDRRRRRRAGGRRPQAGRSTTRGATRSTPSS